MNIANMPRAHQAGHQQTVFAVRFAPVRGHRFASWSVLLLALVIAGLPAQGRAAEDTSASRYLAANCANCHGTQGQNPVDKGISLAGLKADFIVEQMRAFREGKRQATVMHQIARGYSDEQIQTLATYFARQVRK